MTAQEAEPRLVISQMVLENFKSYAGAQHVGPFHKVCFPASAAAAQLRHMHRNINSSHLSNVFRCFKVILQSFTSVVGPNGSGKSNVIDAMLFVFGKRAKQVCCTKTCLQRRYGGLLLRQLVLTEMLMLSGCS